MLHFILWIIVAGIAGFIASKLVNKTGSGLFRDIILGIIGGFVGGFVVSHIPSLDSMTGQGGMTGFIVELLVAIGGAALVILVFNMIFRRRAAA